MRVAEAAAVRGARGTVVEATISFTVLDGWHINAHRPNEDFLVPTVLTLQGAAGVTPGAVRYPDAKQVQLSFSETPLAVYEENASLVVPLSIDPSAAEGPRTLRGTLRFQACNDEVCLPPAAVPVRIALVVAGGGAPTDSSPATIVLVPIQDSLSTPVTAAGDSAAMAIAGLSTGPPPGGAAVGGGNLVGRWFDERGTLLAFVLIFLMGLALNLTPCVYPMMGVTVSLFGGGAGRGGAGHGSGAAAAGGNFRALPRAVVYVLGIALMYSTLGVVAAMTGGLFGGWLASPWVLGAIGLLLLAMALSMFGLYELQVPTGLLSKLGGATGAGYVGTFLAGLMVGVFAAPCIGPPIIALLAHVGAKGDPLFGFQAFFILSLGLGLPYLVLAVFSGLLARLPRSGSWMDWVKHLFGVILLGVAAFYLTLALAPSRVGWVVPAALGAGRALPRFPRGDGARPAGLPPLQAWGPVGVAGIVAATMIAFRPVSPAVTWEPFARTPSSARVPRDAGRPRLLGRVVCSLPRARPAHVHRPPRWCARPPTSSA